MVLLAAGIGSVGGQDDLHAFRFSVERDSPAGGSCLYMGVMEDRWLPSADPQSPGEWVVASLLVGPQACVSELEVQTLRGPAHEVLYQGEFVAPGVAARFAGEAVASKVVSFETFADGFEASAQAPDPRPGSITMRSDAIQARAYFDFLYAWDPVLVRMYGERPRLVALEDNVRVPPSGATFTAGQAGDAFGFRLSGVADWDSEAALSAIEIGGFEAYLDSLAGSDQGVGQDAGVLVDRHADYEGANGLKLGFGVNSAALQTDVGDGVNRTDRVSQPGEALVLVIDTQGALQPQPGANNHYEFVPGDTPFANLGLAASTSLVLSNLHLEPFNTSPSGITCSVDYFIYDVSEQRLLSGRNGEPGSVIGLLPATSERIGTIPGSWTVEDGDIVVLAYNKDTVVFNNRGGTFKHSWGLWSLTLDLVER